MTAERLTTIEHDGLTFDVRDSGPLDGEPVVLLHGFPERSTSWLAVEPLLHARGLRTYALDQRGYSPGARPLLRTAYRMTHLVSDVAALVGAIGAPVHLVGHDWGSAVGWSVAIQRPEMVRTWTAVSVPHPVAFLRSMRTPEQRRRSRYMALFNVPLVPETLAKVPGAWDGWLRRAGMTPEEVDRFRREIVADGALPHALGWYRALPLSGRSGVARDQTVRVPTTMVWSDRDVAITRSGVEGTAALVDADYELVVLDGVTHWIPSQAPAALAEAVLRRVGA